MTNEEAIRKLKCQKGEYLDNWVDYSGVAKAYDMAIKALAEPERKKGKWIPQDFNKSDGMITTAVYYYPKCSECGCNANYTNFCPNCGADMRGEQNEIQNRI